MRRRRLDRRARRVLYAEVVSAGEANRPQRPQPILAHSLLRVAHRAHDAGAQVQLATERVANLTRPRTVRDRVDREVAPREILVEARAELHHRVPPVRLHVAAKGRDLVRDARVVEDADGAELDPDGDGAFRPNRSRTCSGLAGVARSQSSGWPPSSASRIAPPTHHASNPAASRRRAISSTLGVGWSRCMGDRGVRRRERSRPDRRSTHKRWSFARRRSARHKILLQPAPSARQFGSGTSKNKHL